MMAARHSMCGGISDNVREMVAEINKVGISALRRYYLETYPRRNFESALRVVRIVAQYGYAEAGARCSISRQRAHQILKEVYRVAKEAGGGSFT